MSNCQHKILVSKGTILQPPMIMHSPRSIKGITHTSKSYVEKKGVMELSLKSTFINPKSRHATVFP